VVDDGSRDGEKRSSAERIPVRLELSPKVVDSEPKLRTVLAHEMCHVAAWALDREFERPHGPAFYAWAQRFAAREPGMAIQRCHNYQVFKPFRWQCSAAGWVPARTGGAPAPAREGPARPGAAGAPQLGAGQVPAAPWPRHAALAPPRPGAKPCPCRRRRRCGKLYERHKRTIDERRHACGVCKARLRFLGKFGRDGGLVGDSASSGTPLNQYAQFIKSNFASVKKTLPRGTPHRWAGRAQRCPAASRRREPPPRPRDASTWP
jgi:hypothetical protein